MEALNGWLAISSVVAVLAFAVYYPGYLQRSRGCTVFKVWRMVVLGAMELFLIGANQDHPAYFVVVLVAIAVIVIVFLLNRQDAKSWWHGLLMTLWQTLVFIAIVYVFIAISNKSNKKKG